MREFHFTIHDPEGIHARPASLLVKKAKEFTSSVSIIKDGSRIDAKKMFAVMSLGAKKGTELLIEVGGEDEEQAAALFQEFLEANL